MRRNNFIERGRGRRVGPVHHIYCEGETEESYLNAYKRFRKYSCCEIEHSHHADPVGLIQEAIKAKENAPSSDSYWVVYDLEDVSLENKRQAHVEAYRLAQANGIHIALSAISVEVWILLHFTPAPKAYLNCDGAVRALKKYLPNYKKGSANVFIAIQNLISDARKNAVSLQRRWEHDSPNGEALRTESKHILPSFAGCHRSDKIRMALWITDGENSRRSVSGMTVTARSSRRFPR